MAIVVLVCSLGGLALAVGLSWAYADLDRDIETYGARSNLLGDLSRLEEDLAQWTVTSDLVYGNGNTYLIDGAQDRGAALLERIARIQDDQMASAYRDTLSRIRKLVQENVARLQAALELDERDRSTELPQYLASWDSESTAVLSRLLIDRNRLEGEIQDRLLEAGESRNRLFYVTLVAVAIYVLLVGVVWRWVVVTTSRPLLRLARDAETALQEKKPFQTPGGGPLEARQLAASLKEFAGTLESMLQDQTRDIDGLIGLRDALFDAVPFPVIHRDIVGRFLECNAACEAFFGIEQSELVGRRPEELPDSMKDMLAGSVMHKSEDGTRECTVVNAHGENRVVLYTETLVGGVDEESGIVSVLVDITFRVQAELRVECVNELMAAESEVVASVLERHDFQKVASELLSRLGACLGVEVAAFHLKALDGIEGSTGVPVGWGRSDGEHPIADQLSQLIVDMSGWEEQMKQGDPFIQKLSDEAGGEHQACLVMRENGFSSLLILPILIEGAPAGSMLVADRNERTWQEDELLALSSIAVGLGRAIERVLSEQRSIVYGQQLQSMLRELDHRVKNNLATILSMADQTARDTDSIEVFQESFAGRVTSMARAHELLAASKWEGVELREAIRIVMAASRGADRTHIDGVDVMLPPDVATPTCLVLNELATNALKYGSLSRDEGQVHVNWISKDDQLELVWEEEGGPEVSLPFSPGMGTRLIEGFISYQLGGAVELSAGDDGLRYRLTIPLKGR
ncbi:MAG: hypothetical protein CMJ39_04580 [Phycisphaerae bacterium]|nr:hypothetical protein [Phycisphaerae bacterium]